MQIRDIVVDGERLQPPNLGVQSAHNAETKEER